MSGLLVGVVLAVGLFLGTVGCGGSGRRAGAPTQTQAPVPFTPVRGPVDYFGVRSIGPARSAVEDVTVDPHDQRILYAATDACLWRSPDAGKRWRKICPGGRREPFSAVVVDPRKPRALYAGMTSGIVYRSIDGGITWSAGSDGLPSIVALAVDQGGRLYAGGYHGFFRSTDGGASWDRVGDERWWVNTITVSPTRPGTVYVGVTDNRFFHPESALDGGFVKTSDGFDSWQMIDVNPSVDRIDVDAIAVDPKRPRTLLAVDDSLFRSGDGGEHWRRVDSMTFPLGAWPHSLATDPTDPDTLYAIVNRMGDTSVNWSDEDREAWLLKSINDGAGWLIVGRAQAREGESVELRALALSASGTVYVGSDVDGVLTCTPPCSKEHPPSAQTP